MLKKERTLITGKKTLMIFLGWILFSCFAYAELRGVSPTKLQDSISKGVVIIDIRTDILRE